MSDTLKHFSPMSSGMNFSNLIYAVWSTNSLNLTPAIVYCSDFQVSRNKYFSLLQVILPGYNGYTKCVQAILQSGDTLNFDLSQNCGTLWGISSAFQILS